jgi:hypothetical protein
MPALIGTRNIIHACSIETKSRARASELANLAGESTSLLYAPTPRRSAAPKKDRERQQSFKLDDRLERPHQDETNRKTRLGRD